MKRSFREIAQLAKWCAQDLHQGGRFWAAAVGAVIPSILAALAINAHSSRLVITVDSDLPGYASVGADDSEQALFNELASTIQRKLGDEIALKIPDQIATAPSDESKENESLLTWVMVTFVVRVEVTNVGAAPSTLKKVATYIVEEIDGRRRRIDDQIDYPQNVMLAEGQPVKLGDNGAYAAEFALGAATQFLDFETVRLIEKKVAAKYPKQNRFSLASPYIRLLTANDRQRQEELLKIADPTHTARLILGVEVMDVYGRVASGETVVVDSADWNGGERMWR